MKIRSAEYLLLCVLSWVLLLFGGCKGEPSCPDAKESYEYLPEEYRSILPLKGNERLLFLTNTNDTIQCIGKGSKTLFDIEFVSGTNPDCSEYGRINYERAYMDYTGFTLEQKNINGTYLIKWADVDFKFPCMFVGSKFTTFYDSLQVNGVTYLKVSEFVANDSNSRVWVNRTSGVLKFYNKQSNVSWSRIK